jgi:hypothetical protein
MEQVLVTDIQLPFEHRAIKVDFMEQLLVEF